MCGLILVEQISLRLDGKLSHNKSVPKDYTLDISNPEAENLFIFSEKDLPGYKSKAPGDFSARSYLYEKTRQENKPREERKKKWEPYTRRAIPKQTALAGAVKVEANLNPVENLEYKRMMDERAVGEILKKPRVVELDLADSKPTGLFQKGAKGQVGQFGDFIVSIYYFLVEFYANVNVYQKGSEPNRKKAQDNKAARIPENELLDIIIQKFSQYRYWSFKNLRADIKQPEAYLKQTLEKVAKNVKGGDFTGTWTLKNQDDGTSADILLRAEQASRTAKEEEAPLPPTAIFGTFDNDDGEGEGEGDDGDEYGYNDDDDNVEMEDVKL
jgi:transcription initiation factor TFIIF subunit beta